MRFLLKNRPIPLILSILNACFWISFRGGYTMMKTYPFTSFINESWFHLLAFALLGFTVAWTFFAFQNGRKTAFLKSLTCAVLLNIYFYVYNLLTQVIRNKTFYSISWFLILGGMLFGSLLFLFASFLLNHGSPSYEKAEIPLSCISTYRSHLMGIAMLYVILFHSSTMKLTYSISFLDHFVKSGYAGVDIFLFLSGLGMTFSLCHSPKLKVFYKKRILRIYPSYIPWVGFYTLVCIFLGKCGFDLLLSNCLGISFWFSKSPYAFNWYIPALLLFYLIAPWLYHFLRKKRTRSFHGFLLLFAALVFILMVSDLTDLDRLLIAFSRLPIFILGILAGFWIQEEKTLRKSEFYSLFFLFIISVIFYRLKETLKIPLVSWHWLMFFIIVPIFCILVSYLMQKIKSDSKLMQFLQWTGKNCMILYLLNILVVRFTNLFFGSYFKHHQYQGKAYFLFTTIIMLLSVYLFQKCVELFRKKDSSVQN